MEKLVDAEVEKMWQKRLQQWKLEKQARQNLLQEVLESRKRQVEDKRKLEDKMMCESSLFLWSIKNSQYLIMLTLLYINLAYSYSFT